MAVQVKTKKDPCGSFSTTILDWLSQPRHRPVTIRITGLCTCMLAQQYLIWQAKVLISSQSQKNLTSNQAFDTLIPRPIYDVIDRKQKCSSVQFLSLFLK
jgi:hypothetical protein